MTDERVRVSIESGVADVRLARREKLNALDPAMFTALARTGAELAGTKGLRAVVLSGEGAAFCAGLDMASFAALAAGGEGIAKDIAARTHGTANLFQEVALVWRRLPVPVIAALHGAVMGGGLQIALGADIRIVAPDAKLSVMEIRWGIVPDMGGTLLLRDLLRTDVLRDLTYSGRVVSGEEAVTLGLATRLARDPHAAALASAREIAAKNPHAIHAAKRLLGRADEAFAAAQLLAESVEQKAILGSPNQREAVCANLEKRSPVFHDV
jgi:enoyl-CoA hydratase/carnithine racemase